MAQQALLVGNSAFLPLVFMPSDFFLPETQGGSTGTGGSTGWKYRDHLVTTRTRAHAKDGETEARSLVLHALSEHLTVATYHFPLDFLNLRKISP